MVNPEENSNWLVDYGVIENIPVPGGDLPSLEPGFDWCPNALAGSTGLRFLELSSILESGRKPKVDKAVILSDAVQTLTQLRDEAQKLKESSDSLQEKINELKAEKNELRDEKQKLKVEKEKLEQQLKAMSSQPAFFPYPSGIPTPFGAPGQVVGSKLVPFMGYPGVPMWQFMPPTAVDTSEDHALRPPVA
ncbi:hypothetical protein RHGRI_037349 [Rhododendron griersonianum]|uniref:Uncharacterized protein n=1 Tax=Rhododendron griersonianum TaxID=479676 RepID=A0AAV6HS80_9ERIC|nr:hypothetical protein RHGRI_037349 [Rhododendron griersonianum]